MFPGSFAIGQGSPCSYEGAEDGPPQHPTWVKGLHAAVKQADVQLAEVDDVIKGRNYHPPHPGQDTHQDVDGEEQVGDYVESSPAGGEGGVRNTNTTGQEAWPFPARETSCQNKPPTLPSLLGRHCPCLRCLHPMERSKHP